MLSNIFTIYEKEIFKNNLKDFIDLAEFLLYKHNFYFFCEILSKQISNIKKLIPSSNIQEIISVLAFFNVVLIEYSSLMTESEYKQFNKELNKLLKTIDIEVMLDLSRLDLKEIFMLLDNMTRLKYESKDFYSDIFYHFEKLIKENKIPPDYFYMLMDIYCRAQISKPEFIDLLIEKITESISNLKPENFSNFLRILLSLDCSKFEILEKSENYISDNLGKVDDISFANFVFSFCNQEYKKGDFFPKLEEEAFVRLNNMCKNKNYDSIIDILYNFIYSKKTTNFIQNIIKDKLLSEIYKIEKIHSQSVLKIYNIFKELNIKYPITSPFDYFICCNIHEFEEEDLKELNEILLYLNYKESKFHNFFLKCLEIKNPYERIDLANNYIMENMSK